MAGLSTSGDLVLLSTGGLEMEDNTVMQVLQARLLTRRGSCFWDATFGSRLHEMEQTKVTTTFQVRLEDCIRQAVQPMLDSRQISNLAFEHERPSPNQWHVLVSCEDAGQRPLAWDLWVEVT